MREDPNQAPRRIKVRHKPPPVLTTAPVVAPSAMWAGVTAFTCASRRAHGGAGGVPGATAAPLDQLLDPSACWETYRRTYTKPLYRSFSYPFLPSQWTIRRQVTRNATSHSSVVPSLIRVCSRDLAPGAHTSRTHLPYLVAQEATPPLHRSVCVCVCVCVCIPGHQCAMYVQIMMWCCSNLR